MQFLSTVMSAFVSIFTLRMTIFDHEYKEKAKQNQPEVMSDHSSAYRIFSSIRGAVYVFGICIHMQVGTHACECLEGQREL